MQQIWTRAVLRISTVKESIKMFETEPIVKISGNRKNTLYIGTLLLCIGESGDSPCSKHVFPHFNKNLLLDKTSTTAGASSQCYRDELILLKCELMLLKCQINTNTNRNGFLLPTKCLKGVLKYSYLVSIILNFLFMFADF